MSSKSLMKYTLIDADDNKAYEIYLSPEDYEKALSDNKCASNILKSAKECGLMPQKEQLEIHSNDNQNDESNKENSFQETQVCDDENVAIWSTSTTLLFLNLYQQYACNIDKGKCSQKQAFQEISKQLAKNNYVFSCKQCMTKLTSMKRMYKKIQDHNSKSGNERQTWKYYEQMDEIFGKKPWVKPVCTVISTPNDSAEEYTSDGPASKKPKLCAIVDKHLQKMLELKEQSRQDKKAPRVNNAPP